MDRLVSPSTSRQPSIVYKTEFIILFESMTSLPPNVTARLVFCVSNEEVLV